MGGYIIFYPYMEWGSPLAYDLGQYINVNISFYHVLFLAFAFYYQLQFYFYY